MSRIMREPWRRFGRKWFRQPASTRKNRARWQSLFEPLEPRVVLAADPIIAEFQAINASTIQDADGDFSDWIEIRNPDSAPVNLDGWFLTDDATDLRKWRFPAVTVDPGQQILVFASSKDRVDPARQLHTNFRLAGDGEYLGLIKPDGVTVAQDFGDRYPAQRVDQSYGPAVDRATVAAINDSSPVTAWVPTDDSLGLDWTRTDFVDAGWLSGNLGVGYEELKSGFTEREEFDRELGPEWTQDVPEGSTSFITISGGALNISIPQGQDTSSEQRGLAPIFARDVPGDNPADWEVVTQLQQQPSDRGQAGIAILDGGSSNPALMFEYSGHRQFQLTAGGEQLASRRLRTESYFLRLARDGFAKTWSAYYKKSEADDWTLMATIQDGVDNAPVISNPRIGLFARTQTNSMNAQFSFVEVVVPDQRPTYGPRIGLDVSQPMRGQNGSIYMRIPFTLEGEPSRLDELKLATAYDDGFRAYVNGVEVAAQNVPIDSAWNSSAAGTHGAVLGQIPVQVIDVSSGIRTLRPGPNVLAVHGMNASPDDSDFFFSTSLLASQLQQLSERFFAQPTPGQPNLLPEAPAPRIVGGDGVFFGSRTIELQLDDTRPELEIHYTLDGTEPTIDSTRYTGPITLTTSAMLQARTFDTLPRPNFEPSNLASGTFLAVAEEVREFTSDIPIMIIDSLQQRLPASGSTSLVPLNVALFDVSKATGRAAIDGGIVDYLGRGGARDRGASTAGQSKPNMAFETWGPDGTNQDDDFDAGLLGMAADSDWVMHAPFSFDKALIRNQLAFDLSNQMDMWATHFRHVEVYLNRRDGVVDQGDYAGTYVLIEKIKQGKDRIDVATITPQDNQPPEISGGYIWKIDRADPDAGAFTAGRQSINWVYPKSPRSQTARDDQKATIEQQDWVSQYFNAFAETLKNPDINDPEGYSKYIDAISWVDHHMLNVFLMNVDALRLSAYFHKDRGGKVVYGPVWDFDRSAESNDDRDDDPYVWRSEKGDLGTDFFGNGTQRWWGDLFQDPGFWQLYVDRWQMWRQTVLSDENVSHVIDQLADDVRESAVRNMEKWSASRPRRSSGFKNNQLDGTYQGEVENLRQWLVERGQFMDSNFAARPQYVVDGQQLGPGKGIQVPAGQAVEIASPKLQFFDDVKLLSGTPGETIASYFIPTILDDLPGEEWTRPDFDDSAWQRGPTGLGFDTRDNLTPLIATEVNSRDLSSTTILARVPFDVSNLADLATRDLVLRMKYDDGFVAYLNGREVLRQNLRDNDLAYNSRATSHPDEDAVVFEDFDLSDYKNLLVEGTNVLAIRGINSSVSNRDMLILPELVSREVLFGVNPEAKIYYTTDGTDPRGPDGTPSSTARLLDPGATFSVSQNTRVIARNLDTSDRGPESAIVRTDWSGPVQYDFVVSSAPLVISEINFNPLPPTRSEREAMPELSDDDFEFIELYNPGESSADLVGVELSDGVTFDFSTASQTSIPPGQYVLVAANPEALQLRYGSDLPVIGQYAGSLNNNGEDVDLIDGTGAVVFTVSYGDADPWPVRADGRGATLELIDLAGTPAAAQSKYYSWRASTEVGGSPGSAGSGPVGVVINEVLAHTEGRGDRTDSIELYNTTSEPIDISGWYLSDSADNFLKFSIPANTVLAAGQYVVYDESDFNADNQGPNAFALSGDQGDDLWLTVSDGAGGVLAIVDDVHFRATQNHESLARYPNGTGRLAPARQNTFGGENGQPRVGPVVISELNYNPGPPSKAALAIDPTIEDNDLEFLEIHNPTGETLDLANWRIGGGVSFRFRAGTSLAADQSLVVVSFNADNPENVRRLGALKAHYGLDDAVQIVGGYAGQLGNSDDKVVLLRPIASPANQPNFVPRVQEDEVLYDDLPPWPVQADGTGSSLTRTTLTGWGDDATNWIAAAATPGRLDVTLPGDANDDGVFDQTDLQQVVESGKYLADESASPAEGDFNGDGRFDQLDIVFALQRGDYQGDMFAASGAKSSPPAQSNDVPTVPLVDHLFAQLDRR